MRRSETILLTVLGLLSIAGIVWAASSNTESKALDERLVAIRAMTPQEQSRLLANKQRFDRLPASEQQRLREVHDQLKAESDGEELRNVLERYNQWLSEISFVESSSVRSLPLEKRVDRIKQLRHEQFQEQLEVQARSWNLSEQDSIALRRWWTDFVRRNEKQLIEKLPSNARDMLNRSSPDRRQQRLQWLAIAHRSKRKSSIKPLIKPTNQDIEKLMAALTDETRQRLERISSDDTRLATLAGWIQSDMRRRFKNSIAPYVNAAELARFRDEHLRPDELAKVKKLPDSQQRRELAKRYIQWKMSKRHPRGSDSHDSKRGQGRPPRPDHRSSRLGSANKSSGGKEGRPPHSSPSSHPTPENWLDP